MDTFQISITPWKNNANGALTLSFDGAYATSYNLGMDVLRAYKVPATWYVVTGYVGSHLERRLVVSWADLKEMSSKGMEIASHTVTHPKLGILFSWKIFKYICSLIGKPWKLLKPNTTEKTIKVVSRIYERLPMKNYLKVLGEAVESKAIIRRNLGHPVFSFAYPEGRYNSKLKKKMKDIGYLSARSADDGYNLQNSIDFFSLKSKVWDITIHADKANRWVDTALEKSAWLIETFHTMSRDGATDYRFETKVSDFDTHLAYASSMDIWVDTQVNIVKYIKERNASKSKFKSISKKEIVVSVKHNLDDTIYDQPLTLKANVPNAFQKVRVTQMGDVQDISTIKEGENRIILCNIKPNAGEIKVTSL